MEDLEFALPISLCNFPNISTLKLSLKDHPRPLCTKLIRNIFRYVSLLKLRELDLAPPLTHPSANLIPQDHTDDATPLPLIDQIDCSTIEAPWCVTL